MNTHTLFPDHVDFNLSTEGIKYIGSKSKFLRKILEIVQNTGAKKILDGFSGSTRVSQAFAQNGFEVISNDLAIWSKIFGQCYLRNRKHRKHYSDLINHLNGLTPRAGWFTKHYGGYPNGGCALQENGQKKPWQRKNTMKLDAIREEIDLLKLNEQDKAVALTSLILALDKVDNTLGHYVSYLKDWSPRSYNDLVLKIPALFPNEIDHKILRQDIFDTLQSEKADLAYFDPPYGSNNEKMPPSRVRYSSYYHIWKTICLNDRPELFGKANRRKDTSDVISSSVFEEFRKNERGKFIAVEAIDRLITLTNAKFILLSYSSGGRATADELNNVLKKNGLIREIIEIDYRKNVMATMKWTNDWLGDSETPHKEFLFLLEKQ